jgi:hypothetical protein
MAEQVSRGAGKVMQIVEGDPNKVIFVFDEDHRSRLGQIEIAIMLNRLYTQYRVRQFGLEGATADKGTLNLAWAHRQPYFQPGQKVTAREDVIAYTLRAGEIGSAEFMGLIYADVVVHGIDDARLYAIGQTADAIAALGNYLFQIAYVRMNVAQRASWQALYDQKKTSEAFNFAVSTDKFTAMVWGRYADWRDPASAEEVLELLDQVEREVEKTGLKPSAKQQADFRAHREYAKVVSARSDAMVANMLKAAAANPGAPLALTGLGVDHTKRVVELLTKAGVSVVQIRPAELTDEDRVLKGRLTPDAFARKNQGRSVDPAGHLGALLDGRRKPPPVADKDWYKQKVRTLQLMQELATAASEAANKQSITDYQQVAALNSLAEQFRDALREVGISGAQVSQINTSTSPPTVRGTVQFPNGRTISGDALLNGDKSYAFDLEGLLTLDNWKTGSTDTQQISSNAQVTWNGTNIPNFHQEPFWWTLMPDVTMVTVMSDGTKVTKFKDGKVVTEHKDGTKVTEDRRYKVTVKPDGTTVTDYGGGHKTTQYKDGTLVIEREDGRVDTSRGDTLVTQYPWDQGNRKETVYYESDEKGWLKFVKKVTDYVGGLKVTEDRDGTKVREYPGGRTETSKPEGGKGNVVTEYKDDNREVAVYEDGTKVTTEWRDRVTYQRLEDGTRVVSDRQGFRVVVTEYKSGRKVTEYFYPDRMVTEYPGGTTVTEYKDDGLRIQYKDGKDVYEYADGRNIVYDKNDDTKTTTLPGGLTQVQYADNTRVTYDPKDGTTKYGGAYSTLDVTIKRDGTGVLEGLTKDGKWVNVPLNMTGIHTGLGQPSFSVTDSGDVVITWSLNGTKMTVKPDGTTTIERP